MDDQTAPDAPKEPPISLKRVGDLEREVRNLKTAVKAHEDPIVIVPRSLMQVTVVGVAFIAACLGAWAGFAIGKDPEGPWNP